MGVYDFDALVLRSTIHYDVFKILVSLTLDAPDGPFKSLAIIIANRDNRKSHHPFVIILFFSMSIVCLPNSSIAIMS